MLSPLCFQVLDTTSFSVEAKKQGVTVTEVEDLSGKVPHVGFGGATKSTYYSTKSNRQIYVLERAQMYDADAYSDEIWQFDRDFTAEEASAFLEDFDAMKRSKA